MERTILRALLVFRVLALVWMAALVATTIQTDSEANTAVVVTSLLVAVVWTVVAIAISLDEGRAKSTRFLVADGVVAIAIASSGIIAGSADPFFGGFPTAWLLHVAYARNLAWAEVAAGLLAGTQIAGFVVGSPSVASWTEAVGSVVIFFVVATVIGWGIQQLRRSEAHRREAQEELERERQARALVEARAELADRLHDSVLQTLTLVQRWADDPDQVRYLSRAEERNLRGMLREMTSEYEASSVAAALERACDEVEDHYQVKIRRVVSGDAAMEPGLEAMVLATREALVNAAKHSGASRIHLHVQMSPEGASVLVKDRGVGFDPESAPSNHRGLSDSIRRRIEEQGGRVRISSTPGEGTEVELEVGNPER